MDPESTHQRSARRLKRRMYFVQGANYIELLLTKFGFQHVWVQQGVGKKHVVYVFISVMLKIKTIF